MRHHPVGFPTTLPCEGRSDRPQRTSRVPGFAESPDGAEWLRFEPGASTGEPAQEVTHVAFEIGDAAMVGREVRTAPTSHRASAQVACTVHIGAQVELPAISDLRFLERRSAR